MKKAFLFVLILTFSGGCAPEPRPIEYGMDACDFCRMTIVDAQHAAELVTGKGKVFRFDAIECMIHYRQQNDQTSFAFILVNDYERPGELIDARACTFLVCEAIPSPMGAFLSAFRTPESARAFQQEKGGQVYSWESIQAHLSEKQGVRLDSPRINPDDNLKIKLS